VSLSRRVVAVLPGAARAVDALPLPAQVTGVRGLPVPGLPVPGLPVRGPSVRGLSVRGPGR